VAMQQLPRGSIFEKARFFFQFSEKLRFFLFNVRDFKKLLGFLNTFLVELGLVKSDERLFKKSEAFLKHLKRNGGFFQ
jgi:hypothetical protein